ncbi:DLA class I histocompatibility antigen, A9/A9 alpha chain-like isoform X1 [Tachysurus ichikawai]
MIPKTEWIQKISTDDKDYWDRETERVEDNQDSVATVMKSLNQAEVHSEVSVFQKLSPSPEVVCHATCFFPKAVMISWRKDREDVHKDVDLREMLVNQDGSFQKRSILKLPAEELQKHTYTCVIQHSSLEKELVLNVNKQSNTKDGGAGGGSGGGNIGIIAPVVVTLFVLVAAVLVFIWKKIKCSGAEKPHEVQQNGTEIHPLKVC